MKIEKLENFTKGWFVGNFNPSLYKTNHVEVAVKQYKEGDYEKKHYHKIATEITVIISGKVKMNGKVYENQDVIVTSPGESTDFLAMTDAITTVVKIPGANNDKYMGEINA